MKQAVQVLAGSATLYLVMAACAAEERVAYRNQDAGGSSGRAGSSGASGGSSGGRGSSSGQASASSSGSTQSSSGAASSSGGVVSPVPDALAEDGTRLHAVNYVAADGAKQWAMRWHDTARNEDCLFQRAADGQLRCLPPSRLYVNGYYFDAACSEKAALLTAGITCDTYAHENVVDETECAAESYLRTRVYQRGAELSGVSVLYSFNAAGTCVVSTSNPPATWRYYEVGAEVPASSFVRAEVE